MDGITVHYQRMLFIKAREKTVGPDSNRIRLGIGGETRSRILGSSSLSKIGKTRMTPHERTTTSDTMSLTELRERLGVSLTVAYELARKDALPIPAIRVGKQFLFSRTAYDALMSAQHPSFRENARD